MKLPDEYKKNLKLLQDFAVSHNLDISFDNEIYIIEKYGLKHEMSEEALIRVQKKIKIIQEILKYY